jgi:hypothetical protein
LIDQKKKKNFEKMTLLAELLLQLSGFEGIPVDQMGLSQGDSELAQSLVQIGRNFRTAITYVREKRAAYEKNY